MTRIDSTICSICEAACGLRVEHDGIDAVSIRGNPRDPLSLGHICPKAAALGELQRDPDRIRLPMRRSGSHWNPISWQEAIDESAERITRIQAEHGSDSVAVYVGNPTAHNHGTLLALLPFLGALRTRNAFSANSVDAHPRMIVSLLMFGNAALLPVPDVERTDLLVVFGANPVVSNGSILTAPGMPARIRKLQARGGRLVVIDPRRTETARIADEHHFIRPGTDALLLLAMVHVLFEDRSVRLGGLDKQVDGLQELRAIASRFPAEGVADAVGIPADTIRRLARDLASARSAACYGRMGTCTQPFGALATWGLDLLNLLTGNMDRPGGAMFSSPAADLAAIATTLRQEGTLGRWRSRVAGLREFNRELPVAAMLPELETPGKGQIRAMVTLAGNPVLSLPNGTRLDRALEKLEFMLSLDLYINETTRHAHILLPGLTPLERDHHPLLEHAMAARNVARYAPPILARPQEAKEDWESLVALIEAMGRRRGTLSSWTGRIEHALARGLGPRRALDLLLRMGPHPLTLAKLEAAPDGIDLGPLLPRLSLMLRRKRRRIQLVPELLRDDIPRLERTLAAAKKPGTLLLVSRRTMRSHNTWMHNLPMLVRGPSRCTLQMNPVDASARDLVQGAHVRVSTSVGQVVLPVQITDEMMPGVVSMPWGWGHGRTGTRMSVAQKHAGVSMNDLLDHERCDAVTGTSVVNGVEVEVRRA